MIQLEFGGGQNMMSHVGFVLISNLKRDYPTIPRILQCVCALISKSHRNYTRNLEVWPFLSDVRANGTTFPDSSDIKLAVSCLFRTAVDPAVKEKRDTWNPASTTHTATTKKPSTPVSYTHLTLPTKRIV